MPARRTSSSSTNGRRRKLPPSEVAVRETEVADHEQRRLAQHLHDTVCQSFSGIHLLLRVLTGKVRTLCPEVLPQLQDMGTMLQDSMMELHELARVQRTEDFDSAALVLALNSLARATARRVPCTVECVAPVGLPNAHTAYQLYQIAREAVSNAVRHAKAGAICIALGEEGGAPAVLEVRDNGCGFDAPSGLPKVVSGLRLLHHRAKAIGGMMEITSVRGEGTRVRCRLG